MERFAFRRANGNFKSSGGFELGEELFFEGCFLLSESGDVDEVVSLVRVGFQIIESVFIPESVVVDELVAVGPDGKEGGCRGKVPFPVVFVKEVVAPWLVGAFAQKDLLEGSSVEGGSVGRFFHACELQKSRSEIDVENHFVQPGASLDLAGSVGQERDANRVFECIAFVIESVFAEVESVITKIEDDGVI